MESLLDTSSISRLSSIIRGNIRGVNPGIYSSMIDFLRDLADEKESFMITLTESHMNQNIDDHELQLNGWTVSRADRFERQGGCVTFLVKNNLTVADEFGGSDGTAEYLSIYISDLDLAVVTIYRPQ